MTYIFGEYICDNHALHQDTILPSLAKIKLHRTPSYVDIFRECKISTKRSSSSPILKDDSRGKRAMSFSKAYAYGCCFLPTTKDIDIEVSNSSSHNIKSTEALNKLSLKEVPEMISICGSKHYIVWPSLQHITLRNCGGLMKRTDPDSIMASHHQGRQLELETGKGLITRSSLFPDFMIYSHPTQPNMESSKDYKKIIKGMQNLRSLEVGHSEKIEEIFNAEGIQSEGPVTLSLQEMELEDLGELRHIYKDPNNILRLLHLKVLKIIGCGKLRALFTTSTAKSLPRLSSLEVSDCKELVHIIGEYDNDETSACGSGSHH